MAVDDVLEKLMEQSTKKLRVVGPCDIKGSVKVQGSKNANNKLIAALVAVPGRYEVNNYPIILDALEMLSVIELLGGSVELDADNNVAQIDTSRVINTEVPRHRTKNTTGVFGYAGALLGRFGEVSIGKPGGDRIGARPVDYHLDGFRSLGARTKEYEESIEAKLRQAPKDVEVRMRKPSVGATVNVVLAVVASRGSGVIQNTPIEPDMQALYDFLKNVGVKIGLNHNTGELLVDARSLKLPTDKPLRLSCPPDRNEAFTFMSMGCLSTKGVTVSNVDVGAIQRGIDTLKRFGVNIKQDPTDAITVSAPNKSYLAESINIIAGNDSMFHSDWAPVLSVFLALRQAPTTVVDTLYSNRTRHAEILRKLGATLDIKGGGPPKGVELMFNVSTDEARYIIDYSGKALLKGTTINVGYDLRSCAAAVIAASQAEGTTILENIDALYRGYEKVTSKMQSLGINISTAD